MTKESFKPYGLVGRHKIPLVVFWSLAITVELVGLGLGLTLAGSALGLLRAIFGDSLDFLTRILLACAAACMFALVVVTSFRLIRTYQALKE